MDALVEIAERSATPKIIERLEQVRLFYAMTARTFADRLGLEVTEYQAVMTDQAPLPPHAIDALIDELDIQKEWLLSGSGNALHVTGNRDFASLRLRVCRFGRYLGVDLSEDLKDRCADRLSRLPPGHSVEDDLIEELVRRVSEDPRLLFVGLLPGSFEENRVDIDRTVTRQQFY